MTGRAALSVWSLLGLAIVPLGEIHITFGIIGTLAAAIAGSFAALGGHWPIVRLALITVLLAVLGSVGLPFTIWAVVAVMVVSARWIPWLRPTNGWLPAGSPDRRVWWLGLVVISGAAFALVVWSKWTDGFAESTTALAEQLGDLPTLWLVPAIALFVVVNSVTEEIAYRGVAFEAAHTALSPAGTVVATAIAFGTLHVEGFPAGWAGVGLTLVYGLFLGLMRQLTGGLRAPVLVHMAADATIAVVFVTLVIPA